LLNDKTMNCENLSQLTGYLIACRKLDTVSD
jgi:hypothetical protein